jgi:tRNA threonylcarbamoyladenosine biosynthesis protein TsaB
MKILAIETATRAGSVALLDADRVLGQILLNIALTHSERLMAMVDRLLADCGLAPGDLEGLAVSVGPGSFTGLRVGIATAKGLGFALGIPIAPVASLDALASLLPFADAPVAPLLDARKGEVYCSLYGWQEAGMTRRWEYLALSPEEVAERLPAPVIVLGDGVGPCWPFLARLGSSVRVAPSTHAMPWAAAVGRLGYPRLAAGQGVEAAALEPLYLRPSQAEVKAGRG